MATFSILPILTTFLLSLTAFIQARNIPIQQEGFTLDLIHRDSPLSPLYNPASTRLEVITNAYHRSVHRASRATVLKRKKKSPSDIQSNLYSIPGEYIMKISIGTPRVKTLGIADTGSDLTWTQCSPCDNCYNQTTPIFDPSKSSSYKSLSCQSDTCSALGSTSSSCNDENDCLYKMTYGDRSYSEGDLASETITFGSSSAKPVSIKNVVFGCGHNNNGNFNETISGIIGLGGGPLSIVKQLDSTIQGKFSYCLVPIFKGSNVTSQIKFGAHAAVSGPGVVSTPLVTKEPDTYYFLTLESVQVGNKSLKYKKKNSDDYGSSSDQEGNIIIDSGTTLTMLPRDLYDSLEAELKEAIGKETTSDPQGLFTLCYSSSSGDDLNIPTITVSFTGADLDLPPSSTFLEVEEGLVCLTMVPSDELAIFGNLSQENFLVGYDLVSKQVSFKPTDCSSQ